MRIKRNQLIVVTAFALLFDASPSRASTPPGPAPSKFVFSLNVAEFAAFLGAGYQVVGSPFVALHLDASLHLKGRWGLNFGLVYRYENQRNNIFTNFHEIIGMVGVRIGLTGRGLDGLYLTAKLGLGGVHGANYKRVELAIQPEIGYAWSWGRPGFHLTLGVGLLALIHVHSSPSRTWGDFSDLGHVVHYLIPVFNLGLGFAL